MSRLDRCFNIADLRQAAQQVLPRGIFEYVDRGSEDEVALRANRAAFDSIRCFPRVAIDVSRRSTSTTILGAPTAMPAAVAPMSPTGLVWFEGELEMARAAARASIPYTLATESMTSIEKVAEVVGGRLWFQIYVWADRALSHALIERARSAGYEALLVTVDTCVSPNREYNRRNGFETPFRPSVRAIADMLTHPRWLARVLLRYVAATGVPLLANHPAGHERRITEAARDDATRIDPSITWDDLAELRRRWQGKLLVKGVLRVDDARRAVACGADGVVVSNHGARNFDSAISSIEALPMIAEAVGGQVEVLLDSGIRRGSDIAKAVSLGASAVLVGRAALYGLAVAGEAGASHALAILLNEYDKTLAYLGCRSSAELGPHLLKV